MRVAKRLRPRRRRHAHAAPASSSTTCSWPASRSGATWTTRLVIRNFAKQVQTPETLALLTLHTFADSQATSDKLWNGFKDSLLWSLHHKTMQLLTGGTGIRPRRGKAARTADGGSPAPGRRALRARRNCRRISPRCRRAISRSIRAKEILDDLDPRPPLHAPADFRGGKPAGARRQLAQRTGPRLQRREDLHLGPRRPVQQDRRLLQRRRPEHPQRADLHAQRRHRAGHLLRRRTPRTGNSGRTGEQRDEFRKRCSTRR